MRSLEAASARNAILGLWAGMSAATLAIGSASPAAAEPEAVRIAVRSSDVDTVKGARALAFRIRTAADKVCGGEDPIVRTGSGFQRCKAAAIGRAVSQARSPLLETAAGAAPRELAGAGH